MIFKDKIIDEDEWIECPLQSSYQSNYKIPNNMNEMKIQYDSIKNTWQQVLREPAAPAPKKKKPVFTDEQKIKKFDLLYTRNEDLQSAYDRVRQDCRNLKVDYDLVLRQTRQLEEYKAALASQEKICFKLSNEVKEKEEEKFKLTSQIDEFSQRTVGAETDVAEIKAKNRVKNGLLKQLRGYFAWRLDSKKPQRYTYTLSEINTILSTIDRALEK